MLKLVFTLMLLFMVPAIVSPINKSIVVTVTAYTPSLEETDSTPFITASNKRVRSGIIALSRDLERDLEVKFGALIKLDGIGVYEFQDRMNRRIVRGVDIFMWKKTDALNFGRRTSKIYIVER